MSYIYQPTDIVLAKVKGYPAWPALIVPIELIPEHVMRNRAKSNGTAAKSTQGEEDTANNQNEEAFSDSEEPSKYIVYSSILKFLKFDELKSQYCVKFFCDDSYIWVRNNDVQLLTPEDCDHWLQSSKRKNKKLIPAYEMARKGSQGIDVWEFIEYGSAGKPEEEEYIEELEDTADIEDQDEDRSSLDDEDEYDEDDHDKPRKKPKRISKRQEIKRKSEAQSNSKRNQRKTRSKKSEGTEDLEDLQDEVSMEPRSKKLHLNTSTSNKAKGRDSGKKKPVGKVKTVVAKYHYEDDEDWSIVGMGPQDLSAQKDASPLVNRLSQKKNYEHHTELKLDLTDRLFGINKLMIDLLLSNSNDVPKSSKEDFEVIIDELYLALNIKGLHQEFITVFQSNADLMSNFRLLFNLRHDDLQDFGLWNQFQTIFKSIYSVEFVPDLVEWSIHPMNDSIKVNQSDDGPTALNPQIET